MRDAFVNEVITGLIGRISDDDLRTVKMTLDMVVSNYDVSKRCTEITTEHDVYPECVKVYLATRAIEGLSTGSLKGYELQLRNFFSAVRIPIDDISANDIRIYLYRYQQQRNISNRSLDTMRTIIGTFFAWANSEGYIDSNPCLNIKAIKYESTPRGHLTDMELEQIRSACESIREKAIIETFYSTGCRVSEIINIKKTDVDFQAGTIIVKGKGNKTRTVYLNAKSTLALKKYLMSRNDDCEYLFATERKPNHKLTKEGMERIVRLIGERADIGKRVYCHLLRHTTATLGLEHGMDITQVQKLLGHSKISTTMIYADVDDESVRQSHQKALA